MRYQIKVRNPAHSVSIQLALLKQGYRWYGMKNPEQVHNLDIEYLTFALVDGIGTIDSGLFEQDMDTVEYEDGIFRVKHHPQLVVPARNKWRDQIQLNDDLIGCPTLDNYRTNRDSNGMRLPRELEQLCEYILYLEGKTRV